MAAPPPSKKELLNKLLQRGSVFVHLDPRREGVVVPAWLGKKPQLVLQLGLNFPIPIRDLDISDRGVSCTLSFNRAPFFCVLPWSAVYALVAEDGQVTVWPSELPGELVPQSDAVVRRDAPRDRRARPARPSFSVVPSPPRDGQGDGQGDGQSSGDASSADGAEEGAAAAPASEPSSAMAAVARDDAAHSRASDGPSSDEAPPPPARRERPPYLRLVK